jgi:hypothetical protein
MSSSEILSLVLGGFFGLALTLFVQPLIEDKAQGFLVRTVASFWIRPRGSLAGKWSSVMLRDGLPLNRDNEIKNIQLSEVQNKIAGTFTWKERTYRLLASRHANQYLTGTYEDTVDGFTFQGAFQLQILPNENAMVGRWVGFNAQNKIIEGSWEWRRDSHIAYPFEVTSGQ